MVHTLLPFCGVSRGTASWAVLWFWPILSSLHLHGAAEALLCLQGLVGSEVWAPPFSLSILPPAFHTLVLLQAPSALRDSQEKVGATSHAHGISKLQGTHVSFSWHYYCLSLAVQGGAADSTAQQAPGWGGKYQLPPLVGTPRISTSDSLEPLSLKLYVL